MVLNVSGPFHSSLMTAASEMMNEELKKYRFEKPVFTVITNCDAAPLDDVSNLPERLTRQINNAVLWEDSIRKMADSGAGLFIEIGPQKVLSGLLRRIDKTKKFLNVEDQKSLQKTLQEISQ